jgi:hypothetical protein
LTFKKINFKDNDASFYSSTEDGKRQYAMQILPWETNVVRTLMGALRN